MIHCSGSFIFSGCEPKDIVLVENVTTALSSIFKSLVLTKSDIVFSLSMEYGKTKCEYHHLVSVLPVGTTHYWGPFCPSQEQWKRWLRKLAATRVQHIKKSTSHSQWNPPKRFGPFTCSSLQFDFTKTFSKKPLFCCRYWTFLKITWSQRPEW